MLRNEVLHALSRKFITFPIRPIGVHVMNVGATLKLVLEVFRYKPWYALFKYNVLQNEVLHAQNRNFSKFYPKCFFLFHRGPCYGSGGYTKVIPRSIRVQTKVHAKFGPIILIIKRVFTSILSAAAAETAAAERT